MAKAQSKGESDGHGAVRGRSGLAYFPLAVHRGAASSSWGERAALPPCHAGRSAAQPGAPPHTPRCPGCVAPQLHGHPVPRPALSTLRDSGSWAPPLR